MTTLEIYSWLTMFSVAFVCGVLLVIFYVLHGSFTEYSRSFTFTILIVVVLMAAILNSVGTNIAASISLFGALSLLRFRSIVKSTDDMGFLLSAVTIGLVVGTKNYQLLVPILIIVGVLVTIYKFLHVKSSSQTQTFSVCYNGNLHSDFIVSLLNDGGFKNVIIQSKSIKTSTKERVLTICCSGRPCDSMPVIEALSSVEGVIKVKAFTNEELLNLSFVFVIFPLSCSLSNL